MLLSLFEPPLLGVEGDGGLDAGALTGGSLDTMGGLEVGRGVNSAGFDFGGVKLRVEDVDETRVGVKAVIDSTELDSAEEG